MRLITSDKLERFEVRNWIGASWGSEVRTGATDAAAPGGSPGIKAAPRDQGVRGVRERRSECCRSLDGVIEGSRWRGCGQTCILEPSLWQPVWWLDGRGGAEFGVRHRVAHNKPWVRGQRSRTARGAQAGLNSRRSLPWLCSTSTICKLMAK